MLLTTITTSRAFPVVAAALLALYFGYVSGGVRSWPMLLDGVLLALYLWRPGVAALLAVAFLGSLRHVQPWAQQFALWCGAAGCQGWTLRLWLFLLPALRERAAPASEDIPSTFGQTITLPPMVEGAKPSTPAPEPDMPMLLGEGFKLLNSDPTAPHVGVIGATRLGKTEFVGVLIAHRQGQLVIATPKAAQYDPWFGADVARPTIDLAAGNVDYAPIEQAVASVHHEMLRRNTPGASATPGITLILDEVPQMFSELPSIVKKVVNILRMGAGCGIRLILMATDVNVKSWRMDGMAGVLDNLVFARVEGDRQWSVGRLDPNWRLLSPRRLDTGQVHGLAGRVSLAGRGWAGARVTVPDSLPGGLLSSDRPSVGGAGVVAPPVSVPDRQTDRQTALVDYLKARPNATREQTRADGIKFDNDDFGLVKKAIDRGLL